MTGWDIHQPGPAAVQAASGPTIRVWACPETADANGAAMGRVRVVFRGGRGAVCWFVTVGETGLMPTGELLGGCPAGQQGELVGGRRAFPYAVGADGQAWFPGQLEHVEGDLTDLGVAVDLATGAVLVHVLVGPVLPELWAERGELADEDGEVAVEGVASGFQAQHGGGHATGQGPVGVVVPGAGSRKMNLARFGRSASSAARTTPAP